MMGISKATIREIFDPNVIFIIVGVFLGIPVFIIGAFHFRNTQYQEWELMSAGIVMIVLFFLRFRKEIIK